MNMNEIICDYCKLMFIPERDEKEVIEEYNTLFPNDPDKATVCEDCFVKIMDFHEPGEYRYEKYIDKN